MRTYNNEVFGAFSGVLLITSLAINVAPASTWFVKQNATGVKNGTSWQNAFTNLGTALTAAHSGDEIWVATTSAPLPTTYRPGTAGNADGSFQLKAGVKLYGNFVGTETSLGERLLNSLSGYPGRDQVTWLSGWPVDGQPQSSVTHHIFRADASVTSETVVDGFRIDTGGTSGATGLDAFGGGLLNEGGSPVFRNCTFVNLSGDAGSAVYSTGGNPVFINCIFPGNTATAAPGGTLLALDGAPKLINCNVIQNNGPIDGIGGVSFPVAGEIVNSIIWNNGGSGREIPPGPAVTYCIVEGGYPGSGNLGSDPRLVIDGDRIVLATDSPAIDAGNNAAVPSNVATDCIGNKRIRAGIRPDGALDSEARVDLGATEAGGVIFVRPGASFGGDGSSWEKAYTDLYSALTNATATDVRECWVATGTYRPNQGLPSDTTRAFITHSQYGWPFQTSLYGGFSGTETRRDDRNSAANETILTANTGTPAVGSRQIVLTGPGAVVDGFTIRDGPNGGLYAQGDVTVQDCQFINNYSSVAGSAIWINGPGGTEVGRIQRCIFRDNNSDLGSGALYFHGAIGRVENSLFVNNQSYNGGAIFVDSDVDLVNCTIVNNYALGNGGALWGNAQLINCIVWGNRAASAGNQIYGSMPSISCIIEGGWSGSNITVGDPGFVDAVSDFRLQSFSPAIDEGFSSPLTDLIDLAGNARFLDGNGDGDSTVDIGAYEYGIPNQITGVVIGPNGKARVNFMGTTNLTYSVEASTNLTDWEVIGTSSYTGPDFVYRDDTAPSNPRRYYRTRLP